MKTRHCGCVRKGEGGGYVGGGVLWRVESDICARWRVIPCFSGFLQMQQSVHMIKFSKLTNRNLVRSCDESADCTSRKKPEKHCASLDGEVREAFSLTLMVEVSEAPDPLRVSGKGGLSSSFNFL